MKTTRQATESVKRQREGDYGYALQTVENIVSKFGDGEEGASYLACALNISDEEAADLLAKRRAVIDKPISEGVEPPSEGSGNAYMDTREGAKQLLLDGADPNEVPDIELARFFPDPEEEGVWGAIDSKGRWSAIIYTKQGDFEIGEAFTEAGMDFFSNRLLKEAYDDGLDSDWPRDPEENPESFESERFEAIEVILEYLQDKGMKHSEISRVGKYLISAPMLTIVQLIKKYYGGEYEGMIRDIRSGMSSSKVKESKLREDSIIDPDEGEDKSDVFGDTVGELDTEDPDVIPDEFLFKSKMIFLSNLKEIPEAVGDRCLSIGLHYTKSQALDLIESKLEHLCPEYPELDIETKKKIVSFMRKHQSQTTRFSFRSFIHIATIYMSGDPDWESWALIQLKSLPV